MSGDNVWVLGTYMTKFGRHNDKDLIDLASESALGAMKDADVTIHDMEVLGCGSLFNAQAGVGQQLQKQIGQTGIPVYNVANACANGGVDFEQFAKFAEKNPAHSTLNPLAHYQKQFFLNEAATAEMMSYPN